MKFTKGQGTGNDFVILLDEQGTLELSANQIAKLCDRHFGVGADGLIIATRTANSLEVSHLLEEEPEASWFMDYRNADGSKAEMCGNGIRVFARYLIENKLASIPEGSTLPIATRAGIKDLTSTKAGYAVDLGRFAIETQNYLVRVRGLEVARPGLSLNLGNPHVVVALASQQELDALDLSKPPTLEPTPENGANVEFIVVDEPLIRDGVGGLRMRVYERGVGETLSCGTGIAAAALAVRHWAESAQNQWKVRVTGGEVGVRIYPTEAGEHVAISGPAALSFSGEITLS